MIKVVLNQVLTGSTITHATVYSNKTLSESKALQATKKQLRAQGYIVTDMTIDCISARSAMVSAHIQ
jgi:hypothetical protein